MRELDPEPSAKLHPDTAEAHGIAEGDYMRIYNDRGEVVVKAHLSDGVRPGILLCSRGWRTPTSSRATCRTSCPTR